jgi:hypothetical protein
MFEYRLDSNTGNPFTSGEFAIREVINFDRPSNSVTLPNLDRSTYYRYTVQRNPSFVQIEEDGTLVIDLYDFYITRFLRRVEHATIPEREIFSSPRTNRSSATHTLRTRTANDLTLTYNFQSSSFLDIDIAFEVGSAPIVNWNMGVKGGALNFDAEWEEVVHRRHDPDFNNALNIVIMADGFNRMEMHLYRQTVNSMVNALFNNNFFREHRDRINIVRMDTVSLSDGRNRRNIIGVEGGAPFGDSERIRRVIQTNFLGNSNPLYIRGNNTNIDAIVIVSSFSSSTRIFDGQIASKNGQPCNIIVMSRHSSGPALVHQLGHALARLLDESINTCGFSIGSPGPLYRRYFRNLSVLNERLKWQRFIDLGYSLGNYQVPIYNHDTRYHIPTWHSAMRRITGLNPSYGIHFCPVGFYHMQASFLIRTGAVSNTREQRYTGNDDYEWPGYSLNAFAAQFPPSFFED